MAPSLRAVRPGRPRKFGRPSRAVTITLPEDVLERLSTVDADVGRAIVSVVERSHGQGRSRRRQPAEITSYGNHAVIVVTPIKALRRIAGVQLVPVGDGRSLISLDAPSAIPRLELDIRDALDETDVSTDERRALEGLADILGKARRTRGVTIQPRTIIVIESGRAAKKKPGVFSGQPSVY